MGAYCLKHNTECIDIVSITDIGNNKLDENSAQIPQQRVPAIPIINGIIPKQNIEINSSQLVGTTVEAARQTSNYILYDNTSVASVAASLLLPSTKDDVIFYIQERYFITETASNYCITKIDTGKFLINPSQSVWQLNFMTHNTTVVPLIKTATSVDTRSSNYNIYDITSVTEVSTEHVGPTNKDTLIINNQEHLVTNTHLIYACWADP
jgi:hypothetical protein